MLNDSAYILFSGIAQSKSPRKAASRGRPKSTGRTRGRKSASSESLEEEQNGIALSNLDDDVPELEDPDPPSVATRANPVRGHFRLNSTNDSSSISADLGIDICDDENQGKMERMNDDINDILNNLGNELKHPAEEVSIIEIVVNRHSLNFVLCNAS